ncbi:MAG: adenylate/guanylate cyclase domain-containing protein [Spirochaetales bacterium]|nr:adenylate/guanylate cyclase domain-containing protein [Spirochaetales bacterium]
MREKYEITRIAAYLFILCLFCSGAVFGETLNSSNSVFDLSKQEFSGRPFKLKGQWDFYWNTLISPGQMLPEEKDIINLPEAWSLNKEYPIFGYGTYHATVYLPADQVTYGLSIPFTLSHYRMFVNGSLFAESGIVSLVHSKESYSVMPPRVLPLPEVQKLDILIQVSNQDDFHGGLTDAAEISPYTVLSLKKTRQELIEAILFGVYFITGLLYISFFISRRIDYSSLFFGLFCTVLSFRTILYGEYLILIFFPGLSMEFITAAGHITYYLAFPIFMRFIAVAFPLKVSRWLEYPSYLISLIFILLAVFLRHRVYIFFLTYYQILSVLGCLYIVTALVIYSKNKNIFARITIIGFVVFFAAAINDILYTQNIIQTFHMTPLGLGLFILTQASLMTWKIAIAFSQAENLSRELTVTNQSFRRFVPAEFLKYLKKEKIADIALGDHTQMIMSIIFLDIRNFTSMSEKMAPHDIFDFLNSFFDRVCPVIRENGGFIDKYLGDGIMALFPGKADNAVKAAVKMLDMLKIYNMHRDSCGYPPVKIGIGIHTGLLMLGTIGEAERMDGTVISDAVNLCARLESVTKEYSFNIAISEDTYNALENKDFAHVRSVGNIPLKGKQKLISIYELFNGDNAPLLEKKMKYKAEFELAVRLLDEKKFDQARSAFLSLKEKFPEDETTQVYLNKIRKPRTT